MAGLLLNVVVLLVSCFLFTARANDEATWLLTGLMALDLVIVMALTTWVACVPGPALVHPVPPVDPPSETRKD